MSKTEIAGMRVLNWLIDGPVWRAIASCLIFVGLVVAAVLIPAIIFEAESGERCTEQGATPVHIRGDGQFCQREDGTIFRIVEANDD